MGVSISCNESDIKKAYKKQALLIHPDKNSAPGSTEAFKAVGKAFEILIKSPRGGFTPIFKEEDFFAKSSGGFQQNNFQQGEHRKSREVSKYI